MSSLPVSYLLDSQFEAIRVGMDLRPPQRESLRVVHRLVASLPQPISSLSQAEIVRRIGIEEENSWHFADGYVDLTFALATGIGKTRLMGAIMAYLYRTGQSRNFVLLAPRDAILRKLEEECREASAKYIFVHRGIVPQPNVCHRGNLAEFDPREYSGLFERGPNVFILSPQLLSTEDRISKPSELVGGSILEYLRDTQDLVVLVDESHHISASDSTSETRSWKTALSGLKPKLVCSMTATPRSGANIAYSYDLARSLQEGRYTKAIRMIVDSDAASLSPDEYDAFSLRYAISRLLVKESAIAAFRKDVTAFPKINPVLLVCAIDTEHADKVGAWLVENGGLAQDEVLIIHSKKKSEEDLKTLSSIESPTSRIRAIVQVHVLDEGWDVTNVYVIAPLRNVRSYVNGRQVMGRGLRLPAGFRVGNADLDTLDVLAFGQETFQEIYDQATREFGDATGVHGGILVTDKNKLSSPDSESAVDPEDDEGPQTKRVRFEVVTKAQLNVPLLDMIPPEPNFDIPMSTMLADHAWRTAILLGSQTTEAVVGVLSLSREAFVAAVVEQMIEEFPVLSAPIHGRELKRIVDDLLEKAGAPREGEVALDTMLSAKLIVGELKKLYFKKIPTYKKAGRSGRIDIHPYGCIVPLTFSHPLDCSSIEWNKNVHYRIPLSGWKRCIHAAAHFDSKPEFQMAQRIDKMKGVRKWLRNDPAQLVLPTLAGNYGPDFILWSEATNGPKIILLEVKGEHLWQPPDSESRIRARDASLWIKAANDALGEEIFAYFLVLGGDVPSCTTLEDVRTFNAELVSQSLQS